LQKTCRENRALQGKRRAIARRERCAKERKGSRTILGRSNWGPDEAIIASEVRRVRAGKGGDCQPGKRQKLVGGSRGMEKFTF